MTSRWELNIDEVDAEGRVTFHLNEQLYFGAYSTSRRFLAARDHARRVFLFDLVERVQRFSVRLKRPWDAHVSDGGLVVVEDWLEGASLSGAILGFDELGRCMWRRRFKAAVDRSFMSRDGSRVLVSTAYSDHEPHSGKTWLLDSASGDVVWVFPRRDCLRFEGDQVVIGIDRALVEPGNEFFPLNPDGTTTPEYEQARAAHLERENRKKPWWVLRRAKAVLASDDGDLDELLKMLQGIDAAADLHPRDRALVWRYRGEIALRRGGKAWARECWTRALELDPGVGVKRQLAALTKQ